MNYWSHLFHKTLLTMLIFPHFVFSMDWHGHGQPRKSSLNVNASEFIPLSSHQHQSQSILKATHPFEPLHNNILNNKDDYKELSYFHFNSPDAHDESIPARSNSEDLDKEKALALLPGIRDEIWKKENANGDKEEAGTSQNQGIDLTPKLCDDEGENFVHVGHKNQDESESALLSQKEQSNKEREESDKKPTGKLGNRQRRRKQQQQNAANEKLKNELFGEDGGKADAVSSKILDKSYKEKLMDTNTAKISSSFSSSSSRKEKQQQSHQPPPAAEQQQSSTNRGGGNSPRGGSRSVSPHKKQLSKIEKKSPFGIPPPTLKETPEGASHAITVTDKGELDLLARAKLTEDNRYDPLESDQQQKQKQVNENDESDDEHIKQLENENKQDSRRHSAKLKGKSKLFNTNTKEEKRLQNEKEKEEKKMLREGIENAAKQRREQEQDRKLSLDYMIAFNEKKADEIVGDDLQHSSQFLIPPTKNVMHRQGETNTTAGSGNVIQGSNRAINSRIPAVPSAPASFHNVQDQSKIFDSDAKLEIYKILIQIKEILEKIKVKLNELEKQEIDWLLEKIFQFNLKRNSNPNEKEKEIGELINKFELLITEKKKIADMNRKVEELKEKMSNSNLLNNKKKRVLRNQLYDLSKEQKKDQNLIKDFNELKKAILKKFMEMSNNGKPESHAINEIQENMKKPLKYLWTAYNLLLKIFNEYWKKSYVKNHFKLKKPYHFINIIFGDTHSEIEEYQERMRRTLEKMLMHQNIYSTIDKSAYEKLKSFDVLSEKMTSLEGLMKNNNIPKNDDDEYLEKFVNNFKDVGKLFKEELNKTFHDAFHFNMLGIDKLPEVWDKMVLDAIGLLWQWLPNDRKERFYEILMQLGEYFKEEKRNLEWLSNAENDKIAEKLLDLSPNEKYVEEKLVEQSKQINELRNRINSSTKFSIEIKDYMSLVFVDIINFVQSINILLKIQKRVNDAKPLPYLKSVYDKYWYIIFKKRFIPNFAYVNQYRLVKGITDKIQKEITDKIEKEIKQQEKEAILKEIAAILEEMIKIINEIDAVILLQGIWERDRLYENDKDFMAIFSNENSIIIKSEREF